MVGTALHFLIGKYTSKQDKRIKGHVVIPELNSSDYEADGARFTPTKLQLATEASKDENILRWPDKVAGLG